jgi:predicted kinase
MKPQLTVIRGAPGSGKSTLAARLRAYTMARVHDGTILPDYNSLPTIVEMDDFRMVDGKYVYDAADNTRIAHECFERVRELLAAGKSVIVANTFMRRSHVAPYERLAMQTGATYQEYTCNGKFESIHNVDPRIVLGMLRSFEL